ncbi:WGR domain-containing protein [Pelagibacterium lentulum]|uniref:WGR domain-containing protein n=1 Tax=Pelagibacterium lentulum TaxID=2029865 RepID=A0A916R6Q8_9HYPH|nr:WGR domain-containing protein [Pelagibacterium lentulum]GGA40224.1 WGR domain-containing protein [Pelagibacterium lentulum]
MAGESNADHGIDLVRIDPERNMRRFYSMRYEKDLFGQWLLIRRWGRIGRSCQTRKDLAESLERARQAAQKLAESKMRRGYRQT